MARPKIGETRKMSITLPPEVWEWIDREYDDMNSTAAIREIVTSYHAILLLNQIAPNGQVVGLDVMKQLLNMLSTTVPTLQTSVERHGGCEVSGVKSEGHGGNG